MRSDTLFARPFRPPRRTSVREIYDEPTFLHLLTIERRRFEHSRHSFLLLLVSLREESVRAARMPSALSTPLVAAIAGLVRECDFVGWYTQDTIAAAVLAQGSELLPSAADAVAARFLSALRTCLPADVSRRLDVRVIEPVLLREVNR
jgi:hypothetical protein